MNRDDLGELRRTFGPNEQAYQRSLLVVMGGAAFGVFGCIILIQRAMTGRAFDWMLGVVTLAAFAIAGKLFLMFKSSKFSVEVCDQGLQVTSSTEKNAFRWSEISEIQEMEIEGSFPDTDTQICIRMPDETGFVANAHSTQEFDELLELVRAEASKRSIVWTNVARER